MATVQAVLVTVVLLSCVQTGITQCDGKSVFCLCTATLYHQITVHCSSGSDKCSSAGGIGAIIE